MPKNQLQIYKKSLKNDEILGQKRSLFRGLFAYIYMNLGIPKTPIFDPNFRSKNRCFQGKI